LGWRCLDGGLALFGGRVDTQERLCQSNDLSRRFFLSI
jgi:hypothetical protein